MRVNKTYKNFIIKKLLFIYVINKCVKKNEEVEII